MHSHDWWNDCMIGWFMTCSNWLSLTWLVGKGRFLFNFMKGWHTDWPIDRRPSYRDAEILLMMYSGLFIAFPGSQLLKNIVFLLFLKNASPTDGPTDGRTDQRTDQRIDKPEYRDARMPKKLTQLMYQPFRMCNVEIYMGLP